MPKKSYEELRRAVRAAQDSGQLPTHPTPDEMADWAYGNTVIENDEVTREMAETAVIEKFKL
jgi:hypothetical protein